MTSETLELYVKQYIEAQDGPIVEFTWQGGEPSMRGLPFFQEAVALAEKYRAGKTVNHSFQTNGVGLTEEWIRFFADNDVLIGLSIDGPQPVHDTYRVSRSGLGSYEQVVSTLALLKRFGVRFNVLTVVGEHNFNRGQEVYEHLRELGARHIQFIPLVERIQKDNGDLKLCHPNESSVDVAPFSVTAQGFGQFLCDVFDIWVRNDVGSVFVQAFDATLASWCGKPSGICVHSPECGHALALEANGDLFQCDHYVYPEYKLGNIHHQTIRQLNTSQQAVEFGVARSSAMNRTCRNCFFSFACHGGCLSTALPCRQRGCRTTTTCVRAISCITHTPRLS
ncbi:arylsulfatase regulatory protein [Vibrio ishigakensis]|uniref:Arylsulfatase regulatory protein n=1 Tax=Vibrio ishigakensis TaxID=1481914 RepID=A0A0B8Q710_9VIBR|nr:arylsulfatase regulatory protein [Vibrio ishigakensis]